MHRRTFLGSAATSATALAGAGLAHAQTKTKTRAAARTEIYELRSWELRIGPQPKIVNDFLQQVYLPALNKLGVKTVGAFQPLFAERVPGVTLLIPYDSLAHFATVQERLPAELATATGPAAQAYLGAERDTPAYVRIESRLLQAFAGGPFLEVPAAAKEKKPRIFEVRTYEGPSETKSAKKMEMFTPQLGEVEIFKRVGLTPVFFGKTIVGPRMPNFTYMLTFENLAAREKAWAAFGQDEAWKKLNGTPGYGDVMSNISDLVWTPAGYSQI